MQQCGLCSALAEVFRRLLCIGGSRRGSGESQYQGLNEEEARRGGISVDRSENGLLIRMVDSRASPPVRTKCLSQSDWLLLETLDIRCKRPLRTGRFLTMHKRRRKRLITRSLTQDHALLDDIHHGQVQCVLDRVNQWPFNAFTLDNVTGGRSLPILCVHLFHWYGLLDHFKLDVARCWKFFSLIEEGYHSTNPYHNSIHATDVTQAMHCFLQEKKIREYLTPLEIMASLIAAVTHDLDHPGVNQPFLIATSNHLAALYENSSVLENHHWRSAIGCLLESHVAEEIEDCRPELQRQISSLILATDITRQQEFLVRFKRYLDQDLIDMRLEEHRHFILQIALKCADISNPCRPWEVSKKWSQKVCEEFFRQGDYERQLNLPVTALCDRQSTSVPKIQAGFFTFVVFPLFEEWHRFLGDGLSDDMMRNLHGNKLKWDALIKQETGEETRDEISEDVLEDELEREDLMEDINTQNLAQCSDHSSLEANRRDYFVTISNLNSHNKVGRRHSVPLSLSKPPVITRTTMRRESLAVGEMKSSKAFQSNLVEEDEDEEKSINLDCSLLLMTSNDNGNQRVFVETQSDRKILSSENLLPEPSITSITTVTEASRLSSVLGKGQSSQRTTSKVHLKRQQTFPPLQPYVRQRYLSTTAEMSCLNIERSESLVIHKNSISSNEETNESVSSEPKENPLETHCGGEQGCKPSLHSTTPILKENNRSFFKCGDNDRHNSSKRETDGCTREKSVKMAKLLDDSLPISFEKENVDPRDFGTKPDAESILFSRSGSIRKNSTQGNLSRRRGSAPVGSDIICPLALAPRTCIEHYPRRGSVPIDAIRCSADDEISLQISQETILFTSQQHCPYPRRGSVPTEMGWPDSGKVRNRNKKLLRRRSSGGLEIYCFNENSSEGGRSKAEISPKKSGETTWEPSRRRGSLPVDVLLDTHSGDNRETHDS